ncbi:MAG: hypothetical protein AAFX06_12415 [Planctomycetota bacterium]
MRLVVLVAFELSGLAWGTFLICNPAVVGNWQVFGWFASFACSFAVLLTLLSHSKLAKSPLMLASTVSLLTFTTVFVTCLVTAAVGFWANA